MQVIHAQVKSRETMHRESDQARWEPVRQAINVLRLIAVELGECLQLIVREIYVLQLSPSAT